MAQDLTDANVSAIAAENLPAPTIPPLEVTVSDELTDDDNVDNYDGIDWKRLPDLQKPHHSLKRTPSFIYKYGYRCRNRVKLEQIIFICKYCHCIITAPVVLTACLRVRCTHSLTRLVHF